MLLGTKGPDLWQGVLMVDRPHTCLFKYATNGGLFESLISDPSQISQK